MSGVEMHSCVRRNPPREVQSVFAVADASRPIRTRIAAAARAMNAANASTPALSRYSGEMAKNTGTKTAVRTTKRRDGGVAGLVTGAWR